MLMLVALFVVAVDAGDPLFVQVRETELRSGPGFLSPIEDRLGFGLELEYVGERSGWIQVVVTETGVAGWVHASAAKENRATQMQLQGEQTSRTVTSREVALAGRGFSENIEGEYGNRNQIDFSKVDELETQRVDPDDIVVFVTEASLREDFLKEVE
jgi:hypothetical protein